MGHAGRCSRPSRSPVLLLQKFQCLTGEKRACGGLAASGWATCWGLTVPEIQKLFRATYTVVVVSNPAAVGMSLFHCQVAPQHRPVTQPAATVYHLPRSRNFLPSRASADSEQAVESRQEDQPDTSGSVQLTDDRPERGEASGLRVRLVPC